MSILPHSASSVAEDAATALSPVKVCMHVLDVGRTDARVLREASALVEAGFAVSIVDVESERTRPVEEELDSICMKHLIVPSWFVSTRFKPWFLVKLVLMIMRGILRLVQTPADIYHAHDVRALPACYIAARLRGKPLIYDAHELPLSEASVRRWRRLHAVATRLLALMVPSCVGLITVSPPIAQEIHRCYGGPEVTLIRNLPTYRSVPRRNWLRQALGLGPQVRLALYQGNLQSNRGLDRLIRAAPFLEQDTVIVLMGPASRAMQSQLEALIATEGVAERVKILPPVRYEELLDWTASADIGLNVLPPGYSLSIQWCLPNKLFEYLMAGLPVLTSQLDMVVEVIRTYDVGHVVSSLAPEAIAAAINAMLADQVALDRMRRNALQAAQHEFYWEKERSRLIDLYHHILGARKTEQGVQKTPAYDEPPSALES